MSIGKTVSQAPAGACRIKGNGHDRCPGYRTCHCYDGNTGNNDGSGAWLKAGTALVRWRNCPCRNGLEGAFRDNRCERDSAIAPPCVTMTRTLGSSFSIRESTTRPRYFQRASSPSEVSTPDIPEGLNPALVPTRAGFYVPCHVRSRAGLSRLRACPIDSFLGNRTRLHGPRAG
jgi:hypothetical protein